MSVGFGFSVGDFILALELVGTVIDALRSNTAIIQIKNLEFEEGQYAEVVALRQAVAQCQRTIDAFWEKVKKYQPSLGGSDSSMKAQWMKIKLAVCKKEDVARFKADLVSHTESTQVLLTAVQMKKLDLQEGRQVERHKSLASHVQEGFFACMQHLSEVADQGKEFLKTTSSILKINIRIFQIVLQIQHLITNIPGQVERQQPVYMINALGKSSPFHLEFIRSAEALKSVLRANFKKYGNYSSRCCYAARDTYGRRLGPVLSSRPACGDENSVLSKGDSPVEYLCGADSVSQMYRGLWALRTT
ncbi:uncharacterized protein PAC_11075 [Phialocephala subalpina]|uniref:Fungal N-terminal domain-containing protein n=1 Tax=Phialocephala subalpina TaxID=576137 RepID=A0A1L7X825_9HELO|nr:uncharacterized protein PAC_11075 [Phialocephala subalpina]